MLLVAEDKPLDSEVTWLLVVLRPDDSDVTLLLGECQNFRVRGGLSITRMAGQNALRRGWQTDSWLPSNHARRVP
ncbi:hypothetical protein, partial [Burkholderia gladioli]|uniref:hypothetical protein n=1 Tax=Burkholderia gladioli TaxID=28095 RepID=UPI0016401F21